MNGGSVGVRQRRGLALVQSLRRAIVLAAREFSVSAELVAVIVMHESQAAERGLYRRIIGSPDVGERIQARVQGDSASVGIIQMRVSPARQLRRQFPSLMLLSARL